MRHANQTVETADAGRNRVKKFGFNESSRESLGDFLPDDSAKKRLYKTAIALIACADFNAGDYLAIRYHGRGTSGTHWFQCARRRDALVWTVYPEHHLTGFVL